jgi:hypothetical protein
LQANYVIWGPGAVISVMCTIVVITVTFLPETKYRVLPQTLAEMESWDTKGMKPKTAEADRNKNSNKYTPYSESAGTVASNGTMVTNDTRM